MTFIDPRKSYRNAMAVIRGHYEVRRKMAEEIARLQKHIVQLELEIKTLKQEK